MTINIKTWQERLPDEFKDVVKQVPIGMLERALVDEIADLRAGLKTAKAIIRVMDEKEALMLAEIVRASEDTAILNWLEQRCVNVRDPLRYGSRDMFWASPDDEEGDNLPSDIRAQCRAAMSKESK